MRSSTSRCLQAASSMRMAPRRSASLARMAAFMSSVMRFFSALMVDLGTMKQARSGVPRGLVRSGGRKAQYSFLGNCMLRTRLKWRFTAAAFLRLRSAVGFS